MSERSATRPGLARPGGAHGGRIPAADVRARAALQARSAEDAEMDFLAVRAIQALGLGRSAALASPPAPGSLTALTAGAGRPAVPGSCG
jgi:hypothetical protein